MCGSPQSNALACPPPSPSQRHHALTFCSQPKELVVFPCGELTTLYVRVVRVHESSGVMPGMMLKKNLIMQMRMKLVIQTPTGGHANATEESASLFPLCFVSSRVIE